MEVVELVFTNRPYRFIGGKAIFDQGQQGSFVKDELEAKFLLKAAGEGQDLGPQYLFLFDCIVLKHGAQRVAGRGDRGGVDTESFHPGGG